MPLGVVVLWAFGLGLGQVRYWYSYTALLLLLNFFLPLVAQSNYFEQFIAGSPTVACICERPSTSFSGSLVTGARRPLNRPGDLLQSAVAAWVASL